MTNYLNYVNLGNLRLPTCGMKNSFLQFAGLYITATIGKSEVMEVAQTNFISSGTFWTERIGPNVASKPLEVVELGKSWEPITQTELSIRQDWQQLANKHGLKIDHWGLASLIGFTFPSSNALVYKILITQEILTKGFLVANSCYVCSEHTPQVMEDYLEAIDPIFAFIKDYEEGCDVMSLLKGLVCHGGFRRLS